MTLVPRPAASRCQAISPFSLSQTSILEVEETSYQRLAEAPRPFSSALLDVFTLTDSCCHRCTQPRKLSGAGYRECGRSSMCPSAH